MPADEEYIAEVRAELLAQGFDEEFIECAIEDLRDGEVVTLTRGHLPRVDDE